MTHIIKIKKMGRYMSIKDYSESEEITITEVNDRINRGELLCVRRKHYKLPQIDTYSYKREGGQESRFLSVRKYSEIHKISIAAVYNRISRKRLKCVRPDNGLTLIDTQSHEPGKAGRPKRAA